MVIAWENIIVKMKVLIMEDNSKEVIVIYIVEVVAVVLA
jgi:hypothetical protein